MGSVSHDRRAAAGRRTAGATRCTPRSRSHRRRSRRCSTPSDGGTRRLRRELLLGVHRSRVAPAVVGARPTSTSSSPTPTPPSSRSCTPAARPAAGRSRPANEARAAEAAGCEFVVAKGWESGGRKRMEGPTLLPLLDEVRGAVVVPVVAAGGIASARGVAAVFAAGAGPCASARGSSRPPSPRRTPSGCRRCSRPAPTDAVVSHGVQRRACPSPGPHRVLRSSLVRRRGADRRPGGRECGSAGAEIAVARFGPQPPRRESTGAIRAMAFYAGQSAGAVRAIQPAAEIVAELAEGVPARVTQLDRLGLEPVHGRARGGPRPRGEARAVAGAVPAALGGVPVDLAAEVGAERGDGDERAVVAAVAGDLLAGVAHDVALAGREVLDRPRAALGQAVADEVQADLGVLLDER